MKFIRSLRSARIAPCPLFLMLLQLPSCGGGKSVDDMVSAGSSGSTDLPPLSTGAMSAGGATSSGFREASGGTSSGGSTAAHEATTGDSGNGTTSGDRTPRPPAKQRPVIYQLVVRHFGNTNNTRSTDGTLEENGVGKFADIDQAAVGALADFGVTHVWLTGVLRQATLTDYPGLPGDDPDIVKGRAGSFYAIRDYYDVSPDYAVDPESRLDEFDELVQRFHDAGVRVLIDLVPNHVARSYHSVVQPDTDFGLDDAQDEFFSPANNFFYVPGGGLQLQRPEGWNPPGVVFDGIFPAEDGSQGNTARVTGNNQTSPSPSADDWYETVKLNWGFDFTAGTGAYSPVPDTWAKMDAIVAYWQARDVDGFRCDFAHFIPAEAWVWLLARARARDPDVYFVAEAFENLDGLLEAGFDAVYHDAGYDSLKRIYQGTGTQETYSDTMFSLGDGTRDRYLQYLENHDERRIASPIENEGGPDASGFGSLQAGYQLAPLAYFYSGGPILIYNGQEVGEQGSGVEGFGQEDGRTSIFDYWSLPALSRWVNGGQFDGGGLTEAELALRSYYRDTFALAQDPSIMGASYWGLEYYNTPEVFPDCPEAFYSFARFEPGSGRAIIVVGNFAVGSASSGRIRLPDNLVKEVGFERNVSIREVLGRDGATDEFLGTLATSELTSSGIFVEVPDQTTTVFLLD